MRNLTQWKPSFMLSGLALVIAIGLPAAVLAAAPQPGKTAKTATLSSKHTNNPFCGKLGKSVQASQAAQMFCNPPQSPAGAAAAVKAPTTTSYGTNVDAANPQEDITPSGVSIHG